MTDHEQWWDFARPGSTFAILLHQSSANVQRGGARFGVVDFKRGMLVSQLNFQAVDVGICHVPSEGERFISSVEILIPAAAGCIADFQKDRSGGCDS